jgi:long-chain acyl-CoA synthetase
MLNLSMLLESTARRTPDAVALVLGDAALTYAQVDAGAAQVAGYLAGLGIGRGDRVALTCPNLPYFPIVYYGILKAGATVVPLNVLLRGREVAYHLADSGARAYFCFEGTAELAMGAQGFAGFEATPGCEHFVVITVDPAANGPIPGATTFAQACAGRSPDFDPALTDADDTAVVLYTSGTTGQPKGAELTHANMVLNVVAMQQLLGRGDGNHDVHLVTLPLFHSFGQTVQQNYGFACGDTLVLLPRFDATTALSLMHRHEVTFFAGVPPMYWALLGALDADAGLDTASLAARMRVAVAGGAPLPVEIITSFAARFGVGIREGYGLSETSPVATFNPMHRAPKPGSIGLPIWGVEVRLVDLAGAEITAVDTVGEIVIRGHNVMKGYLHRPAETAAVMQDGWFRTGDLATRDADGFYFIVDRAKDMIVRNGFNVYPREIEEVLITHPAVSLVAVIGVPSAAVGEEVKAFVIRAPGVEVTAEELIGWARENMAPYKYPRTVEFLDALPMTATGKVLKRELS